MDKKELEENIKNLKIRGYDIRRNIDVLNQKVQQETMQYNQITEQIQKLAQQLIELQEKEKKDGNDNNTSE